MVNSPVTLGAPGTGPRALNVLPSRTQRDGGSQGHKTSLRILGGSLPHIFLWVSNTHQETRA